jgi:protein SHQ1
VVIIIYAKNTRCSEDSIELLIEDDNNTLHFFSSPYLLKLTFPHAFHENVHESCAQYNPSESTITLRLPKKDAVNWPNLDLIGSLMQPKAMNSRWLKEIIDDRQSQASVYVSGKPDTGSELGDYGSTSPEPFEQLQAKEDGPDHVDVELQDSDSAHVRGYGFANMFHNIFVDFCREGMAQEMLQLEDPETSTLHSRREGRIAHELDNFDSDRYLADFHVEDDYLFTMAMEFEPHWHASLSDKMQLLELNVTKADIHSPPSLMSFSESERHLLSTIPYPLLPERVHSEETEWYTLLDLLFAYVYDHLMTQAEPTVESAWTISCLSSSLSWLDVFESVEDVVNASLRRALVYPYIRNLDFGVHIWKEVASIVEDRRCIIRCLLQVRSILDKSDTFYLGNKLFVDPLLAWLQRAGPVPSVNLSSRILHLLKDPSLKKSLGLDLDMFEKLMDVHSDASTGPERQDDVWPSDDDDGGGGGDSDSDSSYSTDSSITEEVANAPASRTTDKAIMRLDAQIGKERNLFLIQEPEESGVLHKKGGNRDGEPPSEESAASSSFSPHRKLIEEL